jgi:hypothetical protein
VCRVGDSLLHNNQNTAGGNRAGEQIRGRTFHFAFDPESGDSRLEWITQNGLDLIYL